MRKKFGTGDNAILGFSSFIPGVYINMAQELVPKLFGNNGNFEKFVSSFDEIGKINLEYENLLKQPKSKSRDEQERLFSTRLQSMEDELKKKYGINIPETAAQHVAMSERATAAINESLIKAGIKPLSEFGKLITDPKYQKIFSNFAGAIGMSSAEIIAAAAPIMADAAKLFNDAVRTFMGSSPQDVHGNAIAGYLQLNNKDVQSLKAYNNLVSGNKKVDWKNWENWETKYRANVAMAKILYGEGIDQDMIKGMMLNITKGSGEMWNNVSGERLNNLINEVTRDIEGSKRNKELMNKLKGNIDSKNFKRNTSEENLDKLLNNVNDKSSSSLYDGDLNNSLRQLNDTIKVFNDEHSKNLKENTAALKDKNSHFRIPWSEASYMSGIQYVG